MNGFDNINTPLETRVYTQLEEKILSGEYASGKAITELKISSELGVSRTPVREALLKLERDGLVELIPNKGAVVIGVSSNDLIDIYKIRMRLEGLAASLAAERMSDDDIGKLSENVELTDFYVRKNDSERVRELDSAFHEMIYRASGSRMIYRILSDLHRNIKVYRKLSLTNAGRIEKSAGEHDAICRAIKERDASLADRLASEHVGKALENLMKMLPNQ